MKHDYKDNINHLFFAFRNGEEKGFDFFFREYYAALCYFAFRITNDKMVAEEIAEESFIKLWERHANFESAGALRSFLYTTTKNACLNEKRREASSRKRESIVAATIDEDNILQKMIESELYHEIFIAINTLPPKCSQIFKMLYIEGKDYLQIARELNLSINTVRNQKARGILLLRQRLSMTITATLLLHYLSRL
ncbi:MAG TPA: RNA polymerase sigma-70 factor [Chitinophagaceae bacterium]